MPHSRNNILKRLPRKWLCRVLEPTIVLLLVTATLTSVQSACATEMLGYATSFEDVVLDTPTHLTMPITNHLNYDEGTAVCSIDSHYRTGAKSFKMEILDNAASRCEFCLFDIQEVVGSNLYLKEWIYLEPNWVSDSWYELANPFGQRVAPWEPYLSIYIAQSNPSVPQFKVSVGGRNLAGQQYYISQYQNFPLRRGEWFPVAFHVVQHPTNGKLKVWFDSILLCDVAGLQLPANSARWKCNPAKIYGEKIVGNKIWVDDLEYSGDENSWMETTTTTTTTAYTSSAFTFQQSTTTTTTTFLSTSTTASSLSTSATFSSTTTTSSLTSYQTTASTAKIPTTITIQYSGNRRFQGDLKRADTGAYLARMPVKLTVTYLDGTTMRTATYNTSTGRDGSWRLQFPNNRYNWRKATILFEGDDTYALSQYAVTP